jgi:hypothetical protein
MRGWELRRCLNEECGHEFSRPGGVRKLEMDCCRCGSRMLTLPLRIALTEELAAPSVDLTRRSLLEVFAEAEGEIASRPADRWPETVERAYHVGRRAAFLEAAAVLDTTIPDPEPRLSQHGGES